MDGIEANRAPLGHFLRRCVGSGRCRCRNRGHVGGDGGGGLCFGSSSRLRDCLADDGLRPDLRHGRIGEIDLGHIPGAGNRLDLDDAVIAVSLHGCRRRGHMKLKTETLGSGSTKRDEQPFYTPRRKIRNWKIVFLCLKIAPTELANSEWMANFDWPNNRVLANERGENRKQSSDDVTVLVRTRLSGPDFGAVSQNRNG